MLKHWFMPSLHLVLSFSKKSSHITPILHRLNWLPVRFHIQYKILLITFKALHGLPLMYFWSHSYMLPSSHTSIFRYWFTVNSTPQVTSFGGRAFCISVSTLWNSIPKYIRDISSLQDFKNHLKTYLFLSCFSDLWLYGLIHAMAFMFICTLFFLFFCCHVYLFWYCKAI